MKNDPAVLFYTSDFLSGTSFFTYEQKGQYIQLLCEQHQLNLIPESHMLSVCGSLESVVVGKFIRTEDGFYYNERMKVEKEKRHRWCESRRQNKAHDTHMSTHMSRHMSPHMSTHMCTHMGNGNGNSFKIKEEDKTLFQISNDSNNDNNTVSIIDEDVGRVFIYTCKAIGRELKPSIKRHDIIKKRLKEGYTVEQMKEAADNFSKDPWPDRHKYSDIVYIFGIRNGVDNLEKWLHSDSGQKMVL